MVGGERGGRTGPLRTQRYESGGSMDPERHNVFGFHLSDIRASQLRNSGAGTPQHLSSFSTWQRETLRG